MRNTTLFVLLLLAHIIPFTNLHAQTQITSCNAQFTDSGGVGYNYLNNENSEWLICPDDPDQYLSLSFTHVNIEAANNIGIDSTGCYDLLYIYDGKDSSAPLIGSFCGEESGIGKSSFIEGHTLNIGDTFRPKNSEGCFYIQFISDQSKNLSGWEANITCCTPSLDNGLTDGIDVPLATNNGNTFDLIIDNSCTRQGTMDLFTSFDPSGESCYTKGLTLENQAFYAFTSNQSGGFIEFQIDSLDSVGIIEMVVFGPVTLDSLGNYTGGVINDCVTSKDPNSLFFNAGPNQTYILGIATEIAGRSNFVTLPPTVGLGGVLPVKMITYEIDNDNNEVTLTWTTAQEVNNDRFEVYRSFDGIQFNKIGSKAASENPNLENTYTFVDIPNTTGNIYYYIKQMDKDGISMDYAILKTRISSVVQQFSSFPNPSVGGEFSISLDQKFLESDARIQIFDGMGRLVISEKLNASTSFDFQNLTSGMHIIKITSGTTVLTNQHMVY